MEKVCACERERESDREREKERERGRERERDRQTDRQAQGKEGGEVELGATERDIGRREGAQR